MMRTFAWQCRLLSKRWLCRWGVPFGEWCTRCGTRMPVIWHADEVLWRLGHPPGDGACYCPRCFSVLLAERYGVLLRWVPTPYGDIARQRLRPATGPGEANDA